MSYRDKIEGAVYFCRKESEGSRVGGTGETYEDDTIEPLLEPRHRVLLLHLVLRAKARLLLLPPCYPCTWPAHNDVEIHSKDTDGGVVPGTQVDVLLDTEAEVAGLGEVLAAELVLLDLEASLEDLLGLGTADGDVDGDLLVTTDAERAHGVARLRGDGCLASELLEHLRRSCQAIARLANGDVCASKGSVRRGGRGQQRRTRRERTEHELVDADLLHGVGGGCLLFGLGAYVHAESSVVLAHEVATHHVVFAASRVVGSLPLGLLDNA